MSTTHLSSKGQVIIPKTVRDALHWRAGQPLDVVETAEGVLLRSKPGFPRTNLEEVAGSLSYRGPEISIKAMEEAIAKGAHDHNDRG